MQVINSVADGLEIEELIREKENGVALRIKSTEDIREALFLAFAKSGLPLIKLVRNTKTLEDIFLEATSDTWLRSVTGEETAAEDAAESDATGTAKQQTVAEKAEEKEAPEDVSDL